MATTIKKAKSNSMASKSDVFLDAKTVLILPTPQNAKLVWMALQWMLLTALARNAMIYASLVHLPMLPTALHVTLDGPSNQLIPRPIRAPNVLTQIVGFAQLSELVQHAKIPFTLEPTVNALDASQIAKFALIIFHAPNATMDTL